MKTRPPIRFQKKSCLASSIAGLLVILTSLPILATDYHCPGPPNSVSPPVNLSSPGDTFTVDSGGNCAYSGSNPTVRVTATSGTNSIYVYGTLSHTGTTNPDRAIRSNPASGSHTLNVINYSTGVIAATHDDAIKMSVTGCPFSLDNYGRVESLTSTVSLAMQAVDLSNLTNATTNANTITNRSTGIIAAHGENAISAGRGGFVYNYGTISAELLNDGTPEGTHGQGIDAGGRTGVTIYNYDSGSISGHHGIHGGAVTMTIHNDSANGTITGGNGSGINMDSASSTATITNSGTIAGNWDSTHFPNKGDGDGIDVDGTATISNYGTINGNGSKSPDHAEGISVGGGTITNYAGGVIYGAENGILTDDSHGGFATHTTQITNHGTITGGDYAIHLIGNQDDTLTIEGGDGTTHINGTVDMGGGSDTIVANIGSGETFTWYAAYAIMNVETLNKTGSGTLDLRGVPVTAGMVVNVSGGTLIISSNTFDSLNISGGATVVLQDPTGAVTLNKNGHGALNLYGVTLPSGTTLNVNDGVLLIDSSQSLGGLSIGSTATLLMVSNPAPTITKTGSNTLDLRGLALPEDTTLNVNAGTVIVAGNQVVDEVHIANGATLVVEANSGGNMQVIDTAVLTIGSTGKLDLNNNGLIFSAANGTQQAAHVTSVRGWVDSGYDGGLWDGYGITSSTAADDAYVYGVVGVMMYDNTQLEYPSFGQIEGLDSDSYNQVLIKTTYIGDYDISGGVDATDYGFLDAYYYGSLVELGDINADASVDTGDYGLLDYVFAVGSVYGQF